MKVILDFSHHLAICFSSEYFLKKKYNHALGAKTGCTVYLSETTTQCGRDDNTTGQECYVGDSWFLSLKTVIKMASYGFNFVGQVKQCHKNYPKKYLENIMENMPLGNWVVMRTI